MQRRLRSAVATVLVAFVSACGGAEDGTASGAGDSQGDEALRSCPTHGTVEGLDVSAYQARVDWRAVAHSGRHFGIARVSDGVHHLDGRFAANWAGMHAAGLVRGVYQFFRPAQDPIAQADLLVRAVGRLGKGDLPAVLDVEVTSGMHSAAIVDGIRRWTAHVERGTGKRPTIYTSPGFWAGVEGTGEFGADGLWVAHWYVRCPSVPSPWRTFT